MPKDSHLLAPQSRALLRAARAGYIYLLPANKDPQSNDERGGDAHDMEDAATPANKMERSYTARKWSQIPRHVELPEVEFLAKRRPGLPSLYGASGAVKASVPNATQAMRKAKIRKVDQHTGNVVLYDAWIPEGQTVAGEIKDESQVTSEHHDVTVVKATPAPGTVVEGVGVANAEGIVVASTAGEFPMKRKGPPPPKRRGKGLKGRGRKKVMFAPGEGVKAGKDDRLAEGEPDEEDEEDEEEGEEGEEGETDGETIKAEEPPQIDVQMADAAPEAAAPEPEVGPATEQVTEPAQQVSPKLDIDAAPALPPIAAASNVEEPPREQIVFQPQSPVRPESEQLTPPPPSPSPPLASVESKEPEGAPGEAPGEAPEQVSEVNLISLPSADVEMENAHQPISEPSDSGVAKVEPTETGQSVSEKASAIETESKVTQQTPPDASTSTDVNQVDAPAVVAPEPRSDAMQTVQETVTKGPSPLKEEAPEASPVVGNERTESETRVETTIAPVVEKQGVPTAEEQEPSSKTEITDTGPIAPSKLSEPSIVADKAMES